MNNKKPHGEPFFSSLGLERVFLFPRISIIFVALVMVRRTTTLTFTPNFLGMSDSKGKGKAAQSCPDLCNPMDCNPTRFLCLWNFLGKNTGVDSHSFLHGIFPTQGSNPDLLHCRQILSRLSYKGSPKLERQKLEREDQTGKEMANHFSILSWRTP